MRAGGTAADSFAAQAPVTVPCPVLIGRAAELDELTSLLAQARTGRGAVAFVVGEAGIGKSRVVRELADRAHEQGVRVLRGRCVPGPGTVAFRPLTEALAPLVDEADPTSPGLAPWWSALSGILPATGPAAAVEVTTPVRGEAVLRLLTDVAPAGALLVLEDLHWADPETVGILEHLTDNTERAPLLVIATSRDLPSAGWELIDRVESRRGARVLRLGRLNHAQVAAMVYSCTGGSTTDEVDRAVALADGVPFLVEEVLLSPGVPTSVADAIRARLAELPEPDRRVLVAAAAFGRHFDWRLLSAAASVPEAEVLDALDRAVAAQLLVVDGDGFRFRHALTVDAVFESVTPPRRFAVAAAALRALHAAHPELPADQLEVAARVAELAGETHEAARLHLALGEEALACGALGSAPISLLRAVAMLPAGPEQDHAVGRLVEALVVAGRVDDALRWGHEVVARLSVEEAAALHLRLAGAAATASRWPVVTDELEAARQLLERASVPRARAELAIREAELALGTSTDAALTTRLVADALALARREHLPEQECEALQLLGRVARRSSLAEAERWFRQALDAAERHQLALWRLRALHELGTIGLLERSAVDELVAAQRLAEELGAVATAAVLDIEIAAGAAGRDDFGGTIRYAEQAVRRARGLGLDLIVAYGWMHVSAAATIAGDRERAAAAADAARAAAPGNRDIEALLLGGPLFAALYADRVDEALDLATRFTELARGSATMPPAHHRAAWPLLLAVHESPEALAAIDELERSEVVVNRGARGWLGLARAVVAGRTTPDQAAALADEADAVLEHLPVWRSLGRRLTAEAAARDGWRIPPTWLEEADDCLRAHGHHAPADACRRLRGADAGVPTAWARLGITAREADVLRLVIEGCSNREIADRLYLSVRTVEKHVESLLRKTATKSRTQLARVTTTT